jgi:hypothetical protein
MTRAIPAIRREVTVGVDRARALDIFTADITSWWPPAHHIGAAPIAEVVIEHRDLEAFGADADAMHGTFEQDGAWTSTLAAYAAVAGEAS